MAKEKITHVIDIGSSKVCSVTATCSEDRVSVIGVSSVPSKGIRKGVVVDIDAAVESISQALERTERMAGQAISRAFVTIDGSNIQSQNSHGVVAVSRQDSEITLEDIARVNEAAQAISLPSSREIIHVIPRDFIVDKQEGIKDPLGMSGIRLEVEANIIHGSTTAMRNLAKCVQQVGVEVEDFVYGALASAESVLTDTEKELGTILVDIGGGTISMIVYTEGSPAYSAVLPIGGQNITNDLAIGLSTSLDISEKIKIKLSEDADKDIRTKEPDGETKVRRDELDVRDLSLEMEVVSRKLLQDIIRERLREMFTLVAIEIKKSGFAGKLPAGIVLTGGAAETHDIDRIAKDVLHTPVRVGRPQGVTGLIDEINGPAYAATVGALVYGSRLMKDSTRYSFPTAGKIKGMSGKVVGWFKSFLP